MDSTDVPDVRQSSALSWWTGGIHEWVEPVGHRCGLDQDLSGSVAPLPLLLPSVPVLPERTMSLPVLVPQRLTHFLCALNQTLRDQVAPVTESAGHSNTRHQQLAPEGGAVGQ